MVRIPCFQIRGHRSNSGQGTKLPQVTQCSQKLKQNGLVKVEQQSFLSRIFDCGKVTKYPCK